MKIHFGEKDGLSRLPFVVGISDDIDNTLTITVSLAKEEDRGSILSGDEIIDDILKDKIPIVADEEEEYEIIFEGYIMYRVLNESYSLGDEYDKFSGKYFRVYERSRFLESMKYGVFCQKDQSGEYYPGKWVHYGICSQNHVVDIISHIPPVVRRRSV
ncbi:MAG: hypothetical protein IKM61_07850 [Eubacteriaceae bacterium]|nr:hypothetical protein [Eubacteriaceae bacterium]